MVIFICFYEAKCAIITVPAAFVQQILLAAQRELLFVQLVLPSALPQWLSALQRLAFALSSAARPVHPRGFPLMFENPVAEVNW